MHQLLDTPLDEIDHDRLRAALAAAGDEDDRWEAKGGALRPEHVFRAVAGWQTARAGCSSSAPPGRPPLDGRCPDAQSPASRASGWRASCATICTRRHPSTCAAGRPPRELHAALIRVQRHPTHLAVTHDGRVLRREHGSTEPIADGAELTRLARARSGAGPAAPLDPEGEPDELGDVALVTSQAGQEARLRSFVTGLQARLPRAAQFAPALVLDREADRLSAVAASLAQAVPGSPVTGFTIAAHHRVFDAATAIRSLPGGRPDLDLQRVVLISLDFARPRRRRTL